MAGKRGKPEEIVLKLRQVEVLQGHGMASADAVRQIGMTEPTSYRWRKRYGGMNRDQLERLKELETQNRRLRRRVSDPTLDRMILTEAARGRLHSTIVLGPRAVNGLILRAVAAASTTCGTDRHNARCHAALRTRNG